jgi:hypothetical protein
VCRILLRRASGLNGSPHVDTDDDSEFDDSPHVHADDDSERDEPPHVDTDDDSELDDSPHVNADDVGDFGDLSADSDDDDDLLVIDLDDLSGSFDFDGCVNDDVTGATPCAAEEDMTFDMSVSEEPAAEGSIDCWDEPIEHEHAPFPTAIIEYGDYGVNVQAFRVWRP